MFCLKILPVVFTLHRRYGNLGFRIFRFMIYELNVSIYEVING